ncbi:MAG: polysaccharide deacetylase family protein [Candidatus Acidiferrales bacterium]
MASSLKLKLRSAAKWGWLLSLYASGQLRRARKRLAQRGVLVLTFHRVLDDAEFATTFSPQGMLVRRRTFEGFLKYAAENCHILGIDEHEAYWDDKSCCPKIVVTFDDGWADNARNVFPIVQKNQVPLTVFIVAGKLDQASPFWPERFTALWRCAESSPQKIHQLEGLAGVAPSGTNGHGHPSYEKLLMRMKQLPPEERESVLSKMAETMGSGVSHATQAAVDRTMSWAEVNEMARAKVTFGSHTQTHPILPQLPVDSVQHELSESKITIEQKLGKRCDLFSYPNGDSSKEVREEVVRSGYRFAFLNSPGLWTRECDPFSIPRVNVWEGKLAGPSGKFSKILFEYAVFYKSL